MNTVILIYIIISYLLNLVLLKLVFNKFEVCTLSGKLVDRLHYNTDLDVIISLFIFILSPISIFITSFHAIVVLTLYILITICELPELLLNITIKTKLIDILRKIFT